MLLAKVTDDISLAVQLKGTTVPVAVEQKASEVPVLVVDDDVLVEIIDRKLIVVAKLVTA